MDRKKSGLDVRFCIMGEFMREDISSGLFRSWDCIWDMSPPNMLFRLLLLLLLLFVPIGKALENGLFMLLFMLLFILLLLFVAMVLLADAVLTLLLLATVLLLVVFTRGALPLTRCKT